MQRKLLVVSLLLFLCAPVFVTAAATDEETVVTLTASDTTVSVNTPFSITVQVQSTSRAPSIRFGGIDVPGLDAFMETGVSNNTQIKSINGVSTVLYLSAHRLIATQPGTYRIGPVRVPDAHGSIAESNTVTITVTDQTSGGVTAPANTRNAPVRAGDNEGTGTSSGAEGDSGHMSDSGPKSGSPDIIARTPLPRQDIILWALLIACIALILLRLGYAARTDTSETDQPTTIRHDKTASTPTANNIDTSVENDHRAADTSAETDHTSLEHIQGPDLYRRALSLIRSYLNQCVSKDLHTVSEDPEHLLQLVERANLPPERAEALRTCILLCKEGKFAPDDPKRRAAVIRIINSLQ